MNETISQYQFPIIGVVVFAVLVFFVQCTRGGKSRDIDPKEADGMLRNRLAVVVDIREADEVKATGKAVGALWFPTSKIEAGGPEWEKFKSEQLAKDKMVVLYCAVGGRAGRVAKQLAGEGFNTGNMGGLKHWTAAGLPTEPCPSCQ